MLALGCAVALAGAAVPAAAATVQVTLNVPRGKAESVRLRRLPRGTVVGIALSASGRLGVALVGGAQLKTKKPRALFRALVSRNMSFKVVIPESDDYYLVLDNRRGNEAVNVTATVQAVRGKKKAPAPAMPKSGGKLEQTRGSAAPRLESRS
ncbi:MAG: hypothetical protein ACREVC_17310 [Burkholderiales bacterium]